MADDTNQAASALGTNPLSPGQTNALIQGTQEAFTQFGNPNQFVGQAAQIGQTMVTQDYNNFITAHPLPNNIYMNLEQVAILKALLEDDALIRELGLEVPPGLTNLLRSAEDEGERYADDARLKIPTALGNNAGIATGVPAAKMGAGIGGALGIAAAAGLVALGVITAPTGIGPAVFFPAALAIGGAVGGLGGAAIGGLGVGLTQRDAAMDAANEGFDQKEVMKWREQGLNMAIERALDSQEPDQVAAAQALEGMFQYVQAISDIRSGEPEKVADGLMTIAQRRATMIFNKEFASKTNENLNQMGMRLAAMSPAEAVNLSPSEQAIRTAYMLIVMKDSPSFRPEALVSQLGLQEGRLIPDFNRVDMAVAGMFGEVERQQARTQYAQAQRDIGKNQVEAGWTNITNEIFYGGGDFQGPGSSYTAVSTNEPQIS